MEMKLKMFLSFFMTGLSSATIIPLEFGFSVDISQIIATLVPSSLEQCHNACLAKKGCLSFELDRLMRLCRLSSSDRSTAGGGQLVRQPGSVYSQKSGWTKKSLDQACTACSVTETCFIYDSSVACNISECAKPQVIDTQRMTLGSELYVGAKMFHKCKLMPSLSAISVCGSDGTWSVPELVCPTVNIDGKKFKIISSQNNKWWHYDGWGSKDVTSKYQESDDFVKFKFEKQAEGTYKMKSIATSAYMYDGFGVTGATNWLSGNTNTNDDTMQYIVTMETMNYYRIQTKATERYVRLDEDKYVSSRRNLKDQSSLFKFEEV